MNFIIRHPDNYIRVVASTLDEYIVSASAFISDYGEVFPETSTTAQWPGVLYEPTRGGLFVFNKKTREFVQEDWPEGQAVIDALASLLIAKDTRENPPLTLNEEKSVKKEELKQEALSRLQVQIPGVTDFNVFELVEQQWLSIAPAARQPTSAFQLGIDLRGVVKVEVSAINTMTVVVSVTNYDVINDPTWPA